MTATPPPVHLVEQYVAKVPLDMCGRRLVSTWVPDTPLEDRLALLDAARQRGLIERVYVGRSIAHDDHDRLTPAGIQVRASILATQP